MRLGPETGEPILALFSRSLVDEEDRRVTRIVLRRPAKIAHRLVREDSTTVPQEDEQRSARAELVAQGPRSQALTYHRQIEHLL